MANHQKDETSVVDYFAGKSVFITGGTGFVGKVLIEKLLYTCRGLENIYMLIRDKEGTSPYQRLQEIMNQPVFTRIRNEIPDTFDKIVPVPGDITKGDLGIKPRIRNAFIDKISILFHLAASVKFDEPLELAMRSNFEGTRRVLQLSKRMNGLEKFVHLSTAYCHTDKSVLEEVVYPLPFGFNHVDEDCAESVYPTDSRFEAFKHTRPNTYTIAKAMGETLVAEYSKVPTIIIRPSIISPCMFEPTPGWIDNFNGATAIIATTAIGLNHVVLADKNHKIDLVPVDYVSNLCIAAAAESTRYDKVIVYNSCTSLNPFSLYEMYEYTKKRASETGLSNNRPMFLIFAKDELTLKVFTFVLQKMPAYIMDVWRFVKGKKSRFVKLQSDIITGRDLLKYFTTRNFPMRNENAMRLYYSMSAKDRTLFPFDPKLIQWDKYMLQYCKGIRKYLLRK